MNRLQALFAKRPKNLLSIYYTAGYPHLNSTLSIAQLLEEAGVDFIEIGFPYSDPVADGPIIQSSSNQALENGMRLKVLFHQLQDLRAQVQIPVVLMGYLNVVLQYGIERFCERCQALGVDACIIPDLPLEVYKRDYENLFKSYNISFICLISPTTTEARIREIDQLESVFIYMVSSAATTGKDLNLGDQTAAYFNRIAQMNLKHPLIVGFGISNRESFQMACHYASGAIVGSAFVKSLQGLEITEHGSLSREGQEQLNSFIKEIKG
ncbi:MAG: tryptophan synthase subunit alpha [Pedobacter sp.]|nr:MAG: tryptophan synthase subunit alpha [Pedobacter sp.]